MRGWGARLGGLLLLGFAACGGTIQIRSDPPGADVRVGGEAWGRTPITRDALRAGVYRFEMEMEGFLPWEAEISLARGNQDVFATLARHTTPPPVLMQAPLPPGTRVTVIVDPRGSVEIDGRDIGHADPGRPAALDLPSPPPTRVRVRVREGNYGTWEKQVSIEAGRDNRVYADLAALDPWYRYPTDAAFLRRLLQAVASHAREIPSLSPAARIAILPIESTQAAATPIDRALEDAFVASLASAGFLPLERSDAMLVSIAHQSVGQELPYRVVTGHYGREEQFPWEAELASVQREGVVVMAPQDTTHAPFVYERETYPLVGRVPTADQILAYRVLEAAVSHSRLADPGDTRPEPALHRRGELRLHLRLENARTGDILWAGDIGGVLEDEIPTRVAAELTNPPGSFYESPGPPPRTLNLPTGSTPTPLPR